MVALAVQLIIQQDAVKMAPYEYCGVRVAHFHLQMLARRDNYTY
jgi:hypothetical protein